MIIEETGTPCIIEAKCALRLTVFLAFLLLALPPTSLARPPALRAPTLAHPAFVRAALLYALPFEARVATSPSHVVPGETASLLSALKERSRDAWLGPDKVRHTAFSFLWTLGSQYTLVNKIQVSEQRALPVSVASGALVGLLKEVYDGRAPDNYFSHRDLAANAVGIAFAVVLILL